jgi:hypothetical protein
MVSLGYNNSVYWPHCMNLSALLDAGNIIYFTVTTMKNILIGTTLLLLNASAYAVPVVYTDRTLFLADLAALGYSVIHESFEDDVVWADSRNTVSNPGSIPTVSSQGIAWTSNYTENNIATGDVGGSAPDGLYALYSLPHGKTTDSGLYCDSAQDPVPIECYQNDGIKIRSETGDALYAFGGRIDTANAGKVTFLLDGVDINSNATDNIDNWQREGVLADNWTFVGVIDTEGFHTAELLELKGKDFQQVLLFADDFTIGVPRVAAPVAGTVTGIYLNYTFCKNLTTVATALVPVFGATTSWNCTDNGLTATSGDTAMAIVLGAKTLNPASVSGSISGISPAVAICTNTTTSSQVFVPLGGSANWDCGAGGFVAVPGDKVRIILYGTVL